MRISDWSSDVCSSDLALAHDIRRVPAKHALRALRPRQQLQVGAEFNNGQRGIVVMGFQFAERSGKCNRRPPKLVPLPRKFQLLEPEFKEYFSLAREHPGIEGFQKVIDRA